jgi:hypothetical protein
MVANKGQNSVVHLLSSLSNASDAEVKAAVQNSLLLLRDVGPNGQATEDDAQLPRGRGRGPDLAMEDGGRGVGERKGGG